MLTSFRSIIRSIRKHPVTSALAVLALTLGVGLTTSMYSIVHGMLLSPPPFEAPHRIMDLVAYDIENGPADVYLELNRPHDFADWREQQTSFEELAAFQQVNADLADQAGYPQRYDAAEMTVNTFSMLGIQPLLGQDFRADDGLPGAPPVALIGYGMWRQRFAGDPDIVGQDVRINGQPTTILGVMPQGIEFPMTQQVWLPLQLDFDTIERGEGPTLWIAGRLRDGIRQPEAQAEFDLIGQRMAEAWPDTNEGRGVLVREYRSVLTSNTDTTIIQAMFAAVFLVLLIACVNVACLLLAKTSGRSRELAIHTALGAHRSRVVSLVMLESLVLSILGIGAGIALAFGLTNALESAFSWQKMPYWIDFSLQPSGLVFATVVGLVAGLLAGTLPALRASGSVSFAWLKDDARGSSSMKIGGLSRSLVMVELALACALLIVTGLLIHSVLNFQRVDPGFTTDSIYVAELTASRAEYPERADVVGFYEELVREVTAQPGAVQAALMSSPPGAFMGFSLYTLEGETPDEMRDFSGGPRGVVSKEFFDVFDIRLAEGRVFDSRDQAETPLVVVVNESFAEESWPGENAIGQRLKLGRGDETEPWRTVIGVVEDAGVSHIVPALAGTTDAGFYLPHTQFERPFRSLNIAVATHGDPEVFAPELRDILASLAPNVPMENGRTMKRALFESTFGVRIVSICFGFFGGAALLLAALGIFGVTLFSVGQRTREFGIRMALGAMPGDVTQLVVWQEAKRLAVGLFIGLGLAWALASALAALLYGVEVTEPLTFATAIAVLTLTTLLASYLPAWRASRIDPLVALRHD